MTQMTYNLLPKWVWFVLMPLWILVSLAHDAALPNAYY